MDPLGDRSLLEEIHQLGAFTAFPHLLFPFYASCVQMVVLSQLYHSCYHELFLVQFALVIVFNNSNYYSTQVLRTWFQSLAPPSKSQGNRQPTCNPSTGEA